jgi:DnaJ-class molecular chaperone
MSTACPTCGHNHGDAPLPRRCHCGHTVFQCPWCAGTGTVIAQYRATPTVANADGSCKICRGTGVRAAPPSGTGGGPPVRHVSPYTGELE